MIIVTGGAGFIGSCIVSKLNQEGIDDILIVDNLGKSDKWKNLVNKKYSDFIHKSDFLKLLFSRKIEGKIESIIHMGACSSTTEKDADYLMENNFHFTKKLADYCIEYEIRFIYASSASTYGNGLKGFSDDVNKIPSLVPEHIYGYSKQIMDQWVLQTNNINEICGLKFFNVFGPNEYHKDFMKSVVYKAYHTIKETGKFNLFKSYKKEFADGQQQRDFVYVKDVVDIIWWLLNNKEVNGIYNIGTGKARSWIDLVTAVFQAMNLKPEIEFIEMPDELKDRYQYFTQAEMTKLSNTGCPLNFHSLEEAVKDYVVEYLAKDDLIF